MRVLAITNLFPSAESPASGVFIEQQVNGLVSSGVNIRVMFLNRRREGPKVYYGLAPKLQRELAEFAPDLIHVMYGGMMARQITSQSGLPPVIVTFHGSDVLGENFSGVWRRLISHYGTYCSRAAARAAHGVIVVARHLIKALGKVNLKKVRVIPCGIDLKRFKPLSDCKEGLGWRSDHFHVLFATSAGDPVKRPELAQAAISHLERDGVTAQFHVLAGVPNREVPAWLNASDALLLTSRQEGSPTIVKEALACGLPIVSVNVGDVADRIKGIDGCHLADAEPAALARKLYSVFERRQRLDCRDKLRELSCETIAGKLEHFYQEIISRCTVAKMACLRPPALTIQARHEFPN